FKQASSMSASDNILDLPADSDNVDYVQAQQLEGADYARPPLPFPQSSDELTSNSNRSSRNSSMRAQMLHDIQSPQSIEREFKKKSLEKFWRKVGMLFQGVSFLALTFNILYGLQLDGYIHWSWWYIYMPMFAILLIAFLITSSRALSNYVSWIIRFTWNIWVISSTVFAFFVIIHLQYSTLSPVIMVAPILVLSFTTLLGGLYSFVRGLHMNDDRPQRKTKYIVGGMPMFLIGLALTPSVIMIAMRYHGVHPDLTWSICFIPLYTADGIAACFSFFLLLFSLGSRENSSFSIFQLSSLLILIFCSITFKVLLALKLEGQLAIQYTEMFIPLYVGEFMLIFCGINLLLKPPKHEEESDHIFVINPQIAIGAKEERRPLLGQ
ncbi:hypothetical protein SAMD00019534_049630, partial [Acytostelium subglobosum LB1]|uniref:hypothetical protein n=1 Tax=Acytostelium subglobosum LB1 TaxID=1410327 RepID=UPI00064497DA